MGWVSLFSGGKDSSWALYRALESGRQVSHLLTVHPGEDSYMYHTPATHLAGLAAESVGLPLVEVEAPDIDAPAATDAAAQGDREVEPLEAALRELAAEAEVTGLVAGAVESAFQTDRVRALADRLGVETYTPLWQEDPEALAEAMLAAGFEIRVVQVAAAGLDESWLGRRLDHDALADLRDLAERYGIHILGEGGEFETIVTDGPHMTRPIELEAEPVWAGDRGHLRVTDAWLAGPTGTDTAVPGGSGAEREGDPRD